MDTVFVLTAQTSTNELRRFGAIWATWGGEWRHTVKKIMFHISNTKPAQTTKPAPFYEVPTSQRFITLLHKSINFIVK